MSREHHKRIIFNEWRCRNIVVKLCGAVQYCIIANIGPREVAAKSHFLCTSRCFSQLLQGPDLSGRGRLCLTHQEPIRLSQLVGLIVHIG